MTTDLIGYVASALVVLSLMMHSVVRLRVVSLIGGIVFVVYGLLIEAWPIVVTNAAVALVNVWHLVKVVGSRHDIGAVPISADAPFLTDFVSSHLADIRRTQPGFEWVDPKSLTFMLMREHLPAGAFVGKVTGSRLEVELDYVVEAYRDYRIGQWLYGPGAKVFRDRGITEIVARAITPIHHSYLDACGFVASREDPVVHVKKLR